MKDVLVSFLLAIMLVVVLVFDDANAGNEEDDRCNDVETSEELVG